MGYKLKRILIYPDGVTEKQVYPKWNYEYSYDFRGKSIAQLQTDGWGTSNTSNTQFNSTYGIYASGSNVTNYVTRSLGTLFSNAKKIVYGLKGYYSVSNSYELGLSWRSYTTNISTNRTGCGIDKWAGQNAFFYYFKGGTVVSGPNVSLGWLDYSCEFDLVNKTVKYSVNGTTGTGTLTDTDIANIKGNNNIMFYYGQNGSTTVIYGTSVSLRML